MDENKCYNEMCGHYVFPDDTCCSNKIKICKERIIKQNKKR